MEQTTIFDMLYPKYKITKPIRLIEMFSGYGSQALALKYLGVEFEHYKTCEWAVRSIQAYKDIHFPNDNTDYFEKQIFKDDWLISYLFQKGISSNYNEPMTKQQVIRLGEEQRRKIYNNIVATNNLVNIQQVKGRDLEIVDTDRYTYIFTYSFPCQDLSLAGKGKGMSDTSTRSGMLWEVERILKECNELGELPQILLMENVPQVHGSDNVADFCKWQYELEKLGYKNYFQDLIATDYGIPQTRNRCFMVSILGDYSYTFPKPIPLKLKLKDMLEDNVDNKYYISNDLMEHIQKTKEEHKEYTQYERYNGEFEQMARVWKEKSPTLHTKSNEIKIYVKNATKKGYLEATDGDGVDISGRMEYHRGTVQKDKSQSLTTMGGNDVGVVINSNIKNINDENGVFSTLGTNCGSSTSAGGGVVLVNKTNKIGSVYQDERARCQGGSIYSKENSAPTLSTGHSYAVPFVNNELRIRKLTPRECFRLMGVKDEDFEKCARNQSDSSLYHLAGDSIVVNVLMAIFKELL